MQQLKGILNVLLGAASYGLLATFVKLANNQGIGIGALTFFQYLLGFILLTVIVKVRGTDTKSYKKEKIKLVQFGAFFGLTSCFYYLSIQYVPVSVGIILLMQAIWMSVVLEIILEKSYSWIKIIGSVVVIGGTLLAVDVFQDIKQLSLIGIGYGLLASMSYTMALYTTNRISLNLPNLVRSKYLMLGGTALIILFWNVRIIEQVDLSDMAIWKYGVFLAVFGTVIPPVAFNRGFPVTGIGLGSILASVEIPVSIWSAMILLDEQVKPLQWVGVVIIILSIVLINYRQFVRRWSGR